jgi:hypothetical protein
MNVDDYTDADIARLLKRLARIKRIAGGYWLLDPIGSCETNWKLILREAARRLEDKRVGLAEPRH